MTSMNAGTGVSKGTALHAALGTTGAPDPSPAPSPSGTLHMPPPVTTTPTATPTPPPVPGIVGGYIAPPSLTKPDDYRFDGALSRIIPTNIGVKTTGTIMTVVATGAGFIGTTGLLWRAGAALGTKTELLAWQVGPYLALPVAFVAAAAAFYPAAHTLRNDIDNKIRGKLDLRKQSFDDPDEMYDHVKEVRDTMFKVMRIPKRFLDKIDLIVESGELHDKVGRDIKEQIRKLPGIDPSLADYICENIYSAGHFGDNLKDPPHGRMGDPEVKRRWDAYLAAPLADPNEEAPKDTVSRLIAQDYQIRGLLDAEAKSKLESIREVLKQLDYWRRPPVGMAKVVRGIKDLEVSDALKTALLDMYTPMSLKGKVAEACKNAPLFKHMYENEILAEPNVRSKFESLVERDGRIKDVGRIGKAIEFFRELPTVQAIGGYLWKNYKPFCEKYLPDTKAPLFAIRRNLGLNSMERRADEEKYGQPRWYLLGRARPYTSTPFNPLWWGREEFDLGKRLEIFVTALNNVFRQKQVFKGVGELTQTQIKGLISNELEGLKLQGEERSLSVLGHKFIVKGFQDQLAERFNYIFLKVDNLFQFCFSKERAQTTGAVLMASPLVVGIATWAAGAGKYGFWNLVKEAVDVFF